ncbi:MAG TPA: hypothetical protein VHH90_06920 [Polyangia bacterium]|nr:hypothetical protein [Polyangia bacterium]
MRRRLFAPLASTLVVLGMALLTSCGSSLGGPTGTGGSGGGNPSGSGGAGTGGMVTGGSGGTAGGSGGAAGGVGVATGGSGGRGGAGGKGGAPGTGGAQVGGKGGAAPCGTQSCASNEVCVRPGCGGGVAVCEPLADGGQCPTGWILSLCAGGTGRMGCMPGPCTPPAPFCAPLPASCGGIPNCTCLPFNVCGQYGGQCTWILNGGVMCGSE